MSLPVPKTHKLYIGGAFPRSESGRSYPLVKPGAARPYATPRKRRTGSLRACGFGPSCR